MDPSGSLLLNIDTERKEVFTGTLLTSFLLLLDLTRGGSGSAHGGPGMAAQGDQFRSRRRVTCLAQLDRPLASLLPGGLDLSSVHGLFPFIPF